MSIPDRPTILGGVHRNQLFRRNADNQRFEDVRVVGPFPLDAVERLTSVLTLDLESPQKYLKDLYSKMCTPVDEADSVGVNADYVQKVVEQYSDAEELRLQGSVRGITYVLGVTYISKVKVSPRLDPTIGMLLATTIMQQDLNRDTEVSEEIDFDELVERAKRDLAGGSRQTRGLGAIFVHLLCASVHGAGAGRALLSHIIENYGPAQYCGMVVLNSVESQYAGERHPTEIFYEDKMRFTRCNEVNEYLQSLGFAANFYAQTMKRKASLSKPVFHPDCTTTTCSSSRRKKKRPSILK